MYLIIALSLLVILLLGSRIRVGPVVEDFEADLRPVLQEGPTWMASGKAHRERYKDGREVFDLRCRGLRTNTGTPKLPVGAAIDVVLDGEALASVPLRQGQARLKLDSRKGGPVPVVAEGTAVALRYEGVLLLEGVFELD